MEGNEAKRVKTTDANLTADTAEAVTSKAVESKFLSIPQEARDMIYNLAAEEVDSEFLSGTFHTAIPKGEWPAFVGLLASCKQVYAEFHPLFHSAKSRIDVSSSLDAGSGAVKASVKPHLIRHIKIKTSVLAGINVNNLLNSMENLKSFLYYGCAYYTIGGQFGLESQIRRQTYETGLTKQDQYILDRVPTPTYDQLVGYLETAIRRNTRLLTRGCKGHESDDEGDEEDHQAWCEGCGGDKPVQEVARAWDARGRPFRLIAEVRASSEFRKADNIVRALSFMVFANH